MMGITAKRVGLAVVIALFAVAAVAAVRWAREPLQRQRHDWEQAIPLRAGAEASGGFTPQHAGPLHVSIRIQRPGRIEELADRLGASWLGRDGAPGLAITYGIRAEDEVVASGRTGRTVSGWRGPHDIGIQLASIDEVQIRPHEVRVRVEHAQPGLAEYDAWAVVGPAGDWINYAWFEAALRQASVAIGLGLVFILGLVTFFVRRRRCRLKHAPDPPVAPVVGR